MKKSKALAVVAGAMPSILRSVDFPQLKIDEKTDLNRLPDGDYYAYSPVLGIGKFRINKPIVDPRANQQQFEEIIISSIKEHRPIVEGSLSPSAHWNPYWTAIQKKIGERFQAAMQNIGGVRGNIISQLYHYLMLEYKPWKENKARILSIYRPIFSMLAHMGARYDWMRSSEDPVEKEKFIDLLKYALDEQALSMPLATMRVNGGGGLGFDNYAEALQVYLTAGANINVFTSANPKSGPYLQVAIANEMPFIKELLKLVESKRDTKKPNTQFDYTQTDGYGNTPLMLAIRTRNERAALALLKLNKKNIGVGISAKDKEGRSPLQLAAALGMKNIVKELLSQGAREKDLLAYARLPKEEVRTLVSPYIHPDRADLTRESTHSYLYGNDVHNTPLCYYPDGQVKTGKEQEPYLIVLSNLSPYREILDAVIDCLQRNASQGDPWSKQHLPYVKKQVDDIRYSAQFQMVNTHFYSYRDSDTFLKKLHESILEKLNQPGSLFEKLLKDVTGALDKEIKNGNKKLQMHLNTIQDLIKNYPAQKSFLEKCQEGQQEVQAFLQQPKAQQFFSQAKELKQEEPIEGLLVDSLDFLSQGPEALKRSVLEDAVDAPSTSIIGILEAYFKGSPNAKSSTISPPTDENKPSFKC